MRLLTTWHLQDYVYTSLDSRRYMLATDNIADKRRDAWPISNKVYCKPVNFKTKYLRSPQQEWGIIRDPNARSKQIQQHIPQNSTTAYTVSFTCLERRASDELNKIEQFEWTNVTNQVIKLTSKLSGISRVSTVALYLQPPRAETWSLSKTPEVAQHTSSSFLATATSFLSYITTTAK